MRISDFATGKNSRLAKIAASLGQREEERMVYIIYHKDLPPKVEVENPAILAIPAIFLDGDLANPDHPAACPFNTGGHTPPACRWKPSHFYEAIATAALPNGCPFKKFCPEWAGKGGTARQKQTKTPKSLTLNDLKVLKK